MAAWARAKNHHLHREDRRQRLVVVAVFLLALLLSAKVAYLAGWRKDYYTARADRQHKLSVDIAANRGQIFIRDARGDDKQALYPLAASKPLLTIYAVPSEVAEADKVATVLYDFFKKSFVEKEVDEQLGLEEDDRLSKELSAVESLPEEQRATSADAVAASHEQFLRDPLYGQAKQQRRQELIEAKKQAILEAYKRQLTKRDDPYEPLEKRVDIEVAKAFHLALLDASRLPAGFQAKDLDFNNGRMTSLKVEPQKDSNPLEVKGLGYEQETFRVYPEKNIASHLLGFVAYEPENKAGQWGRHGRYGLEGFFDEELFGKIGKLQSERGGGGVVIPNNREYTEQKLDGDNLVLTIDRGIQFFVSEKIKAATERYQAESGTVIVLEPNTGAILAMASYPDFDPNNYPETKDVKTFNNPSIFDQYEPGSVFKAITMASALNEGKVSPETTFNDPGQIMIKGWPKPIKNSDFDTKGGHGLTTMTGVLENSLNTGAIFAMRSIGDKRFAEYVKAFGFGERSGVELEGEATGNIGSLTGKKIREISAATASFGQGISVTPLQMAVSYAALVNGGRLVKPYVVAEIHHANGEVATTTPSEGRRVLNEKASAQITGMLVQVVENGHSTKAKIPGYYVGGKTGTAQVATKGGYEEDSYNHTFISFGPAEKPRFVLLVKFRKPKGFVYADSTAVPTSRDILTFLFDYLQIPKTRQP